MNGARHGAIPVVDDQPMLRNPAVKFPSRSGRAALAAGDAEEASARFGQNPGIDRFLTDVVMPGPGGPAVAKTLSLMSL